jgi:hypothetical protein
MNTDNTTHHSSGWANYTWARHFQDHWQQCQGEDGEKIAELAGAEAEAVVGR